MDLADANGPRAGRAAWRRHAGLACRMSSPREEKRAPARPPGAQKRVEGTAAAKTPRTVDAAGLPARSEAVNTVDLRAMSCELPFT